MNIFDTIGQLFHTATVAAYPAGRRPSGTKAEGEECTPCAANAYATQAALQAQQMLGATRAQQRAQAPAKRSRAKKAGAR